MESDDISQKKKILTFENSVSYFKSMKFEIESNLSFFFLAERISHHVNSILLSIHFQS